MQVRSATPAQVGIAPCELKFRAAGKKGKRHQTEEAVRVMLQAAAGREDGGARAWCSLLDACEAEVKGRNEHTR